ncbi:Hypothetical protein, putative [Bodo saltans]|uniref:Uncharacterized protein n=1 Tax=Bodo saltans TaxID=75058 RepID=A0A0S4KIJ5_BODSA|nr:Hypothetical protein, putative [Bodo saltans]|eukprot:CUI14125.1 Hypothetical protein, putative [Bodo saltans]
MNPTAPVWVSSGGTSGGGGAAALSQQQQRSSTLDPTIAEFHPKHGQSTAAKQPPPSQPSSFTKYVGNPVVHQIPSGSGGSAAGHHAAYGGGGGGHLGFTSHQTAAHGPSRSSGGAAGFSVNRHSASGAAPYSGVPPQLSTSGGGGRHQQSVPSGNPYAPSFSGSPYSHPSSVPILASRGHVNHQHHHHHHGPSSTANLMHANAAQQYSVKTNTHWGSAGGPPSNMQQTHHATNGAVLYNQQHHNNNISSNHNSSNNHSRGRGGAGHAMYQPQHSNTGGGGGSGASDDHNLPQSPSHLHHHGSTTPQHNKSAGLHEDVLFTPSTRGIWSGAAEASSPGAADSAYTSLLDHTPANRSQDIDANSERHDVPAVSAAVNSLLLDTLTGGGSGAHADDAANLHDAWGQRASTSGSIDADSTPWARLLTPPPATLSLPEHHSATNSDQVDTVQHLLAQLTKQSSDHHQQHAFPHEAADGHVVKSTSSSASHVDPSPVILPRRGASSQQQQQQQQYPVHQQQHSVVIPPSAIGGSPTSPEMHKAAASATVAAQLEAATRTLVVSGGADDSSPPLVMKAVPRSMQQHHVPNTAASVATNMKSSSTRAQPTAAPAAPTQHTTIAVDEKITVALNTVGPPPPPSPAATTAATTTASPGASDVSNSRRWKSRAEVVQLLASAKETMRHIKILSFSKKYPEEIAKLFQGWAAKGKGRGLLHKPRMMNMHQFFRPHLETYFVLPAPARGPQPMPATLFANRGPNYKCRFHHMCLFCKGEDHGWFDESKCARFQEFRRELGKAGVTDGDIEALVEAYDTVPAS